MNFLAKKDERYGDFIATKILAINELQCVLKELRHEPTGATVIHLANEDPENLFCLSFQTLPKNSRGAAHILEHTVLCGSKKFPVKDPFFAMTRRSLNTFMNAFTGSDFTCYPAASQVAKDFYNLLDVYLDAVFHPRLRELSFLQEGHRLEFAEPENPKSPLVFKGIVYNEMKGSLSAPDTRLWHAALAALFPDLTYGNNSGGDPKEIPDLTYEELIAFHETYYHPSRCLFFFYGNLPLQKHLDFIAEKALKNVLKEPPLPPLPRQKRFAQPVVKRERYPIQESSDLDKKSFVAVGWLTVPLLEQQEVLALSLLDAILMDTDASLLKRAILKSDLCVSADAYIDTEMSEVPYFLICKGCNEKDAKALYAVIERTLKEIVKKGIPFEMIEAALHQLEFGRTEIAGDHAPFGLTLFMRSILARQHGCPPENALMIHSLFDKLYEKVKDPTYLTGLIQKHFLDNPHSVRLVMAPDPNLAAEEEAAEKKRLEEIRSRLDEQKSAKILKQTQELATYQREIEHQSLDCLPKVSLKDVPVAVRNFPLRQEKAGNLTLFHHACFTNQILYADLIFDLSHFSEEELPYVQLMASLISELGCGKRSFEQNLEYAQAHTGGVGATCSLYVQAAHDFQMKPTLAIRGKALLRKADKLFPLLRDLALAPRFDEKERLYELIEQIHTALQNRLSKSALRYAIQLALSGQSLPTYIGELWHGVRYYKTIEELLQKLEKKPNFLIDLFASLKERLFSLHEPHLVLSCTDAMYEQMKREGFYGLQDLPAHSFKPWTGEYAVPAVSSQARTIASPVAFTCEAFKAATYLHPQAPSLNLAAHIFDNKILHKKVREEGGAYGVGATYTPLTGSFYFHSYRDPHIGTTLKTFHAAIEQIAAKGFDARDLEEAKLGMIQQFDVPIAPGNRAVTGYTWWREGRTKEMRQRYRDQLLAASEADIARAVEEQLLPQKEKGTVVTFAGKELLKKEKITLPILTI